MAGNKGKGLHSYTVQEAQNATMGQAGSVYLDTDGKVFTPTSGVVVAITMVQESDFDTLTAETGTDCFGIANTGFESGGDELANTDLFPAGLTIYGRWTSVSLNTNGACICYIG
jgi:hypothetical protein